MTAYNIVGESPASAPVEVFVGEAGKSISCFKSYKVGDEWKKNDRIVGIDRGLDNHLKSQSTPNRDVRIQSPEFKSMHWLSFDKSTAGKMQNAVLSTEFFFLHCPFSCKEKQVFPSSGCKDLLASKNLLKISEISCHADW